MLNNIRRLLQECVFLQWSRLRLASLFSLTSSRTLQQADRELKPEPKTFERQVEQPTIDDQIGQV